jgi:hypothetical protein
MAGKIDFKAAVRDLTRIEMENFGAGKPALARMRDAIAFVAGRMGWTPDELADDLAVRLLTLDTDNIVLGQPLRARVSDIVQDIIYEIVQTESARKAAS